MQSIKYLEMVREKYGITTDRALAEKIGVGQSAMSHYMKGNRIMDEETCLAVAIALEVPPDRILMAAGLDRAERSGQKSLWEVFSKQAAMVTGAVVLGGVTLLLSPTASEAAPVKTSQGSTIYIM